MTPHQNSVDLSIVNENDVHGVSRPRPLEARNLRGEQGDIAGEAPELLAQAGLLAVVGDEILEQLGAYDCTALRAASIPVSKRTAAAWRRQITFAGQLQCPSSIPRAVARVTM